MNKVKELYDREGITEEEIHEECDIMGECSAWFFDHVLPDVLSKAGLEFSNINFHTKIRIDVRTGKIDVHQYADDIQSADDPFFITLVSVEPFRQSFDEIKIWLKENIEDEYYKHLSEDEQKVFFHSCMLMEQDNIWEDWEYWKAKIKEYYADLNSDNF